MTHNCNYLEIVTISENYDQGQILAANIFSIVQQWTVGTSLFSDLVVAIVLSKTTHGLKITSQPCKAGQHAVI